MTEHTQPDDGIHWAPEDYDGPMFVSWTDHDDLEHWSFFETREPAAEAIRQVAAWSDDTVKCFVASRAVPALPDLNRLHDCVWEEFGLIRPEREQAIYDLVERQLTEMLAACKELMSWRRTNVRVKL